METIDFIAALPETTTGIQKLGRTLELFGTVRERARSVDTSTLSARGYQDLLAEELGVDRFMVEDIARVLLKQTSPIFPEYLEQGFWTFGRQAPHFGTPWGGLTFYDTNKNINLIVRYGGSFDDEEDPPHWTSCPVASAQGVSYKELAAKAMKCKSMDLWLRMDGDKIVGKLVFR